LRPLPALLAASTAFAGLSILAPPAHAADEVFERPVDGVFPLVGHGWGHGRGMSQYGAYGAATQGKAYGEILAFYYPNTTPNASNLGEVRARLESYTGGAIGVRPEAGLSFEYYLTGQGYNVLLAPTTTACGT